MTEFLVYVGLPAVLFFLIKTIVTQFQEEQKAEMEEQERERELMEKWEIESKKKKLQSEKEIKAMMAKNDEDSFLKLFGLERYKE
jgi:hypothetical protein